MHFKAEKYRVLSALTIAGYLSVGIARALSEVCGRVAFATYRRGQL